MAKVRSRPAQQPAPPPLSDAVTGRSILKVLALWAGLSLVAGLATAWSTRALEVRDPQLQTLLIVVEVYALLPIAMLIVYGGWRRLAQVVRFRWTSWRDLGLSVGMYLATLATVCVAYVLLGFLLGPAGDSVRTLFRDATFISRIPGASVLDLALIGLQTVFLAALAEELLFRGLLFSWLRARFSAATTVLVVAAIFGLQHFIGPAVAVAGFVWGVGAGLLREKTGSTLNTVIMHMLGDCTLLAGAYVLFR